MTFRFAYTGVSQNSGYLLEGPSNKGNRNRPYLRKLPYVNICIHMHNLALMAGFLVRGRALKAVQGGERRGRATVHVG